MYFEILKIMLSFSVQTGASLSCHFGSYYEACLYYGRSPGSHSGQSHCLCPGMFTAGMPCLLLHPQTSLLPGYSGSSLAVSRTHSWSVPDLPFFFLSSSWKHKAFLLFLPLGSCCYSLWYTLFYRDSLHTHCIRRRMWSVDNPLLFFLFGHISTRSSCH